MDKFATQPEKERRDVLQEVATKRDVTPIIIEKDFWVCWTLHKLSINPDLAPFLTFKGGTSLSKAYGLIERFSEDIDLTISRNAPFVSDSKDPMEPGITANEVKRRIDALKGNAQLFVEKTALPKLATDIKAALGDKGWEIALDAADPDRQTLLFFYPRVFAYAGYGDGIFGAGSYGEGEKGYIKPHIKLEFGARGEPEPNEPKKITAYVAQDFPQLFTLSGFPVATLAVERSFWEKATILHALHHGSNMRDRMSRHYYDTFQMMQGGVAKKALETPALLEQVVRNKSLMFRDTKASYETAKFGSLKLIPRAESVDALKKDYEAMEEMFMSDHPDFKTILKGLEELEALLNKI